MPLFEGVKKSKVSGTMLVFVGGQLLWRHGHTIRAHCPFIWISLFFVSNVCSLTSDFLRSRTSGSVSKLVSPCWCWSRFFGVSHFEISWSPATCKKTTREQTLKVMICLQKVWYLQIEISKAMQQTLTYLVLSTRKTKKYVYIYMCIPKDPGMSYERDWPYNPIVGMGWGPSNLP